jgi:hypothetical protein
MATKSLPLVARVRNFLNRVLILYMQPIPFLALKFLEDSKPTAIPAISLLLLVIKPATKPQSHLLSTYPNRKTYWFVMLGTLAGVQQLLML